MLQHCVFLSLKCPQDIVSLQEPMALISRLVGTLPGVLSVTHGPNLDLEGKSRAYQYGFVVTVSDASVLSEYGSHPDHQKAAGMLVSACEGGSEGILVADIGCGQLVVQ